MKRKEEKSCESTTRKLLKSKVYCQAAIGNAVRFLLTIKRLDILQQYTAHTHSLIDEVAVQFNGEHMNQANAI